MTKLCIWNAEKSTETPYVNKYTQKLYYFVMSFVFAFFMFYG